MKIFSKNNRCSIGCPTSSCTECVKWVLQKNQKRPALAQWKIRLTVRLLCDWRSRGFYAIRQKYRLCRQISSNAIHTILDTSETKQRCWSNRGNSVDHMESCKLHNWAMHWQVQSGWILSLLAAPGPSVARSKISWITNKSVMMLVAICGIKRTVPIRIQELAVITG